MLSTEKIPSQVAPLPAEQPQCQQKAAIVVGMGRNRVALCWQPSSPAGAGQRVPKDLLLWGAPGVGRTIFYQLTETPRGES